MEIKPIAKIITDFPTKFGIPRQSGLVERLTGEIVFEPDFQNPNYIRGLEQFSHLWLIWGFSENKVKAHGATVRPPRLGGNTRLGVFSTRSPFRPNNLGLSAVKLEEIIDDGKGLRLLVSGCDMMSGTPIYDIKPYIPYSDSIPSALGGFAEENKAYRLEVEADESLLNKLPEEKRALVLDILANDPRPQYQDDDERIYGFEFAGFEIKFRVLGGKAILEGIEKL